VFRYFEQIDEESNRFSFWEIAVDGPALELRHGPVGTVGKHEVEMCASDQRARVEYDQRIAEKLAGGFHECTDRRLDTRTRALEEAIEVNPDDVATYLVYADWIQTLGDPRGGLIVAQAAGASSPAAVAYLAAHAELFLGPLVEHVGYDGALLDLTWRCGFIQRAQLSARDVWTGNATRVFEQLLAHPSARWLTELALHVYNEAWSIQGIVDALARHPSPMLETLELGHVWRDDDDFYDDDRRRRFVNLSNVWRAVPNVRRLVLRGDADRIGPLELGELEHLEVETRDLAHETALAIASAACPRLSRLELRYRWRGSSLLLDQLQPILESPLMRRLEHFAVTGAIATDELCRALGSLRRPSLRELDLSRGTMTDVGAELLAATGFSLDILDVTHNRLTPRGIGLLDRIAKLVIAERQQPRY
jgi:uncharacterized protein (TIGR02996 family)